MQVPGLVRPDFFRVRFDRLTPKEKDYLRAMAALGPGSHRSGDVAAALGVRVESVAPRRSGLIRYWRTKSGLEVDFVLGREAEAAIEVKGTSRIRPEEMKGIRAFCEEHRPRRAIVVSNDPAPRRAGDIDVLPWAAFLDRLWGNEIV